MLVWKAGNVGTVAHNLNYCPALMVHEASDIDSPLFDEALGWFAPMGPQPGPGFPRRIRLIRAGQVDH
jgi:hypothetical protein